MSTTLRRFDRRARAILAVCITLLIAGCATLPAPTGTTTGTTTGGAPSGTTKPATTPPAPAAAAIDSGPSTDAVAVLGSIPEPLRPEERIAADSTDLEPESAEPDTGGVPVPQPRAALGEDTGPAPGVEATPGEAGPSGAAVGGAAAGGAAVGGAAAGGTPPATPPATPPPSTAPAKAASDTCWRVQLAAPSDAGEAELKRKAAESLLLIPIAIESSGGRHKVRTRDCTDHATAIRIRGRAEDSGFTGAFIVSTKP